MPTKEFLNGFRHEVANRAFALKASEILARRLEGHDLLPFWQGYLELERFNAPRYRAAAKKWNVATHPGLWSEVKAHAIGFAPPALQPKLLAIAYPRTVDYLEELRRLRGIGPADETGFLDYMVEQEVLQVEMMQRALNRQPSEAKAMVEKFLEKYADA